MNWKLKLDKKFIKSMQKIDMFNQKKIMQFLENILESKFPYSKGKALIGNKKRLWRYRINDFRVICSIHHNILEVIALDVGHRKKIYK